MTVCSQNHVNFNPVTLIACWHLIPEPKLYLYGRAYCKDPFDKTRHS